AARGGHVVAVPGGYRGGGRGAAGAGDARLPGGAVLGRGAGRGAVKSRRRRGRPNAGHRARVLANAAPSHLQPAIWSLGTRRPVGAGERGAGRGREAGALGRDTGPLPVLTSGRGGWTNPLLALPARDDGGRGGALRPGRTRPTKKSRDESRRSDIRGPEWSDCT